MKPGRKKNEVMRAAVVAACAAGLTVRQAAEQAGCSVVTAYVALREAGSPASRGDREGWEAEAIAIFSDQGKGLVPTAAEVGKSVKAVRRVLVAAGLTIQPRGAGPKRPAIPLDRLRELVAAGNSTRAIAAAVGRSPDAVLRRMREAGMPTRPGPVGGFKAGGAPRPRIELDETRFRAMVASGMTLHAVARELGVSSGLVAKRMAEWGIPSPRPKKRVANV